MEYMRNGGTIEHAQAIAAREPPLTTKLYDPGRARIERLPKGR